jgi:two-component system chemotaxis response regulator CheB
MHYFGTNDLKNRRDIILIGASTGGPNAIEKVISG